MYYGHGSWIVVLVFGGMFVVRTLTAQRRRAGRRGGPPPGSQFTRSERHAPSNTHPPVPGSQIRLPPQGSKTYTGTAPGWFTDPFVRHEQRYWSGSAWTEQVTDEGVPGIDPP